VGVLETPVFERKKVIFLDRGDNFKGLFIELDLDK
jgi:hypothetical protein